VDREAGPDDAIDRVALRHREVAVGGRREGLQVIAEVVVLAEQGLMGRKTRPREGNDGDQDEGSTDNEGEVVFCR
jgi:hypothetical protein